MQRFRWMGNKTYRRYLLSFFVLAAGVALTLSFVLFTLFSRNALDSIHAMSKNTLALLDDSLSMIVNQVFSMHGYLVEAPDVAYTINAQNPDKVRESMAILQMRAVKNSCDYLSHVGIYNAKRNFYLNTEFFDTRLDAPVLEALRQRGTGQYMLILPYTQQDAKQQEKQLLAFIFRFDLSDTREMNTAIVLVIDREKLAHKLFSGMGEDTRYLVLDAHGQLLLGSAGHEMDTAQVQGLLTQHAAQGSFVSSGEEAQIVTHQRMRLPDWTLVLLQSYDKAIAEVTGMRRNTVYLTLGILLLGVCLSIALTSRLYQPIRRLLTSGFGKTRAEAGTDALAQLAEVMAQQANTVDQMNASEPIFRRNYLLAVAESEMVSYDMETVRWLGLEAAWYSLYLLCWPVEGEELCERLEAVLRPCVPEGDSLITAPMGGGLYMAVLLGPGEAPAPNHLLTAAGACLATDLDSEEIILVYGGDTDRLGGLPNCLRTARQLMGLSLFLGLRHPLTPEELDHRRAASVPYPVEYEEQLRRAVRRLHREGVRETVNQFIGLMSGLMLEQARLYIHQMIIAMLKEYLLMGAYEAEYRAYSAKYTQALTTEDLQGIARQLIELCDRIIDGYQRRQQAQMADFVESVDAIIERRYPEPSFSINDVADAVGLSADYAGRIYKAQAQVSFAKKLTQRRIERACELLWDTELPIAAISEQVGIPAHSHFYSLFKQVMKMTPNAYRLQSAR